MLRKTGERRAAHIARSPSLAPHVSEEDDARLDPSDILVLTTMDSVSTEPTSETTTNTLVAFLDILRTSELVNRGHFGRATAYGFVNPAGVAARKLARYALRNTVAQSF